ncbi:hypothetical protein F4804DRAFT_308204 [Jackrogersella minutella]|nr:hypothetical protein F4804DRAFT_308204 [Jackrogersella minutella]
MKSWSLVALSLLAAPVFGRALPTPAEQEISEPVRRADESETLEKKNRGGPCGHDEQTFGNVSACQSVCSGGGCAPHTVNTGLGAGGMPVVYYECIC